jgi:hypothetical protein
MNCRVKGFNVVATVKIPPRRGQALTIPRSSCSAPAPCGHEAQQAGQIKIGIKIKSKGQGGTRNSPISYVML